MSMKILTKLFSAHGPKLTSGLDLTLGGNRLIKLKFYNKGHIWCLGKGHIWCLGEALTVDME